MEYRQYRYFCEKPTHTEVYIYIYYILYIAIHSAVVHIYMLTYIFGNAVAFLFCAAQLVSHFCQLANKCCQIALRLLAINNGTFVIYTHKLQQTLKREKNFGKQMQALAHSPNPHPPPCPRSIASPIRGPGHIVPLLLLLG